MCLVSIVRNKWNMLQCRVWVKPNAEQQFLYGNNILKSGVGRMSEGCEARQGVVVYSMSDMPLGFGITAKVFVVEFLASVNRM